MLEDVLQAIVHGLVLGSIYALAGIGLTLVYGILRLTNFSHGDMLTVGAYSAWVVNVYFAMPLVLGLAVATAVTATIALITEFLIWRPLRRARAGTLQLLLTSIGLALVIRHVVQFLFGAQLRRLDVDITQTHDLGLISISTLQLVVIGAAVIVLCGVGLLLARTVLGKAMRALSDNFDLAESSGIDTNRIIIATWLLAGGLAGFGGVLFSVLTNVAPHMGWNLLLTLFAAVILGGIGNAYGALAGGFILGIAQELSTLVVDPRYKLVVGFTMMIAVLIVRPQGLFGRARAVN